MDISGTLSLMIAKFCTRNQDIIWKISTEKKIFTIFFSKNFSKASEASLAPQASSQPRRQCEFYLKNSKCFLFGKPHKLFWGQIIWTKFEMKFESFLSRNISTLSPLKIFMGQRGDRFPRKGQKTEKSTQETRSLKWSRTWEIWSPKETRKKH